MGETARDIIAGHFAHITDPTARNLLETIATGRIEDLGTRFAAGHELTAQPPRMFSELGYDPTSDSAMRNSSGITISEIAEAIREGHLRLNYSIEIGAANRRRATTAARDGIVAQTKSIA